MSVNVIVSGDTAYISEGGVIVCGNSGQMINITFDDDWNEYTSKTAVFKYFSNGAFKKRSVLFQGNSVEIPVLPTTNQVSVYLYAGDLHTTIPASIQCIGETEEHDPPAPDVYNQLMEYLAGIQSGGAQVGNAVPALYGTAYSVVGIAEETEET